MERIRETARRAIIGDEVLPVCEICPKINSRTFESEDERRKHTAVEFYETYLGEDYEKQRAAVAEVAVSSKYRSDYLSAMKKITNSFWDEINRLYTACKYCRQCYRECVSDPTQTRGGEMLDIIATKRPLLFDPRVFLQAHERHVNMLREIVEEIKAEHPEGYLLDGNESDELSQDGSESSLFYDWSKHVPSEYELKLDKWANEKETEGKAECLCGTRLSDGSECDEMSLD